MKAIALFIILAMWVSSVAGATTFWVAKTGDDADPGTESEPFLTIQKAFDSLGTSDDITIKAGTYIEFIRASGITGTAGDHIVIQPFESDVVIADGTGLSPTPCTTCGWWINGNSAYVDIIGIEFQNWDNQSGLVFGPANNILIDSVESHDNDKSGIWITNATDQWIIRDCSVHDNGFHGIHTSDEATNGLIQRVLAFDNIAEGENDGIHVGCSFDVIIEDSIAWNNYENGFDVSGHCRPSSERVTLRNSVAHSNRASGIKYEGWESIDNIIENVLTYGNGLGEVDRPGINISGGDNVIVRHTTSWNNNEGFRAENCATECKVPMLNLQVHNNIFDSVEDALSINSSVGTETLDYNGYEQDVDTSSAIGYKGTSYWLTGGTPDFDDYVIAKSQDANSYTADHVFVNTADPIGPDGLWFTADDGLLLQAGSPGHLAANDGKDMGYAALDGGGSGSAKIEGNVTVSGSATVQ